MPLKRKKTETEYKSVIEQYGLSPLLYPTINESFIQELLKGNSEDWNEMKDLLGKLRILIPKLIIKITKLGGRTALNLTIAVAKRAYRQGKKHKKILLDLFYALVFILIGYVGNSVIRNYNEHPTVKGTQMEMVGDSLQITDTEESSVTVVSQPEKSEPIKVEEKKQDSRQTISNPTIRLLKKGETSPTLYKVSDKMAKAIFECESCVLHLYDAKNPRRKITKRDILNPRVDLTWGAGHKLTPAERKAVRPNSKLSKQQALKLFKKDLRQKEIELNNALKRDIPWINKVVISQNFFDGLFSLTFNMGIGNMAGNGSRQPCEVWKRLQKCRIDKKNGCINQNDINYVIAQVKKQNITEKGHHFRRKKESEIMSKGNNDVAQAFDYHLIAPEYRQSEG